MCAVSVQTHAVVAAPARGGVSRLSHLLHSVSTQVSNLLQAAIMKHSRTCSTREQIVRRPHFTHLTHLIVHWLQKKENKKRPWAQSLTTCKGCNKVTMAYVRILIVSDLGRNSSSRCC